MRRKNMKKVFAVLLLLALWEFLLIKNYLKNKKNAA